MIPHVNDKIVTSTNNAEYSIFFDISLANLIDAYTAENSLYISEALDNKIGRITLSGLLKYQRETIAAKSKIAADKSLKARY